MAQLELAREIGVETRIAAVTSLSCSDSASATARPKHFGSAIKGLSSPEGWCLCPTAVDIDAGLDSTPLAVAQLAAANR